MVFDGDPKKTVVFPESSEGLSPALVEEYEKVKQKGIERRLNYDKIIKETIENFKKYTRCSASTIARILKPVMNAYESLMAEKRDLEWDNVMIRHRTTLVEKEGDRLRELVALKKLVLKYGLTEKQHVEKLHISNSNVEKVTVKTETKYSNDSESENKLIDYRKESKSLCEGQGIAKIVFENELDYSEDKVSMKAGKAKEIFVMKSNNVLCWGEIKADKIQNSSTESTYKKDENIGVTDRCTEANISDDKLCSGDQTPGKAQRSVTFTQYETKKQSVQQKIVSDVIDSNVDLVKDQEERDVQNTVLELEKESMQLLKNMLVVENTKHDYKANCVSSMDCDSYKDEAKRKKVDQKAEDTVTCPVTVACDQNVILSHQSISDQLTCGETKSKRVEEEPRPRKDPPQAILLNWSDTKTGRVKEEPRPRKDPPHSGMMVNDTGRRTMEEHRPRKDPPMSRILQYGHRGNLFGCRHVLPFQSTVRTLVSC
ncbi:hypothetical protein GCK72_020839 [Caenorhabditis remanei]|uniref:Uncharacterized protein n=1 Tax=Caenorhabditis remanei TaxID=31234 RepID=A0A6A5GIP4_CAERE|nr:hypothetical protein GCK72_020839 [Caenorhabditis remanei]KAF1754279.1 hypothetical protein GCK72_020839 [Caenorhabditis remanei]